MLYWTDRHGSLRADPRDLFCLREENFGPLFQNHGLLYFGSHAECFLGPSLGGITDANNQPNYAIQGFGLPWVPPNRPNVTFDEDDNAKWIRGHLINGGWGGSGTNPQNLVPLTSKANGWHRGVESMIKNFLICAYNYEVTRPYKSHWYGVFYRVARSQDPMARVPAPTELYSYAPSHIGVTWRAVRFKKPAAANTLEDAITFATANYEPVSAFPADFRTFNAYNPPSEVNRLSKGRSVFATDLEPWEEENNGFDDSIEIHNTL